MSLFCPVSKMLSLVYALWVDVSSNNLEQYFRWQKWQYRPSIRHNFDH